MWWRGWMAAGDGRAPSPEPLRLGCTGQENGSKSEIAEAGAWRRKRDGSPQPLLELSAPTDPTAATPGTRRGRFLHREGQISAFPALPGPNFSLPRRPVPPAGARRRPPPSRLPRSASPGAPSEGWPRLRAAGPAPPSPVPPCLTVAVGRLWSRPSPPQGPWEQLSALPAPPAAPAPPLLRLLGSGGGGLGGGAAAAGGGGAAWCWICHDTSSPKGLLCSSRCPEGAVVHIRVGRQPSACVCLPRVEGKVWGWDGSSGPGAGVLLESVAPGCWRAGGNTVPTEGFI